MSYTSGSHTVFHHRYHIVWITKYRYQVLEGALRERIRTIIRQVCKELGVQIVSGVLSREHVHMFVEIPPHIAVSDFVRRVKGRSSHRVQMEFPDLRRRYWGRHFWARGYFSTTSGNITDGVIRERIRTIIRQLCKELGVQIVSSVSWKSRRILRSATSCGASRDAHRIRCRWSSRTCASNAVSRF